LIQSLRAIIFGGNSKPYMTLVSTISILMGLLAFAITIYNHLQQTSISEALQVDVDVTKRNQILRTENIRMPVGGKVKVLATPEGIQLRTITWLPKQPSKGTILLCQGYSEFIEKYDEVIQHLLDRQFAVLTVDWRGQGLSSRLIKDPQKGHITTFSDFIKDADLVQEHLMQTMPIPHFIMGHSMGGHIAFRVLQEYPARFQKAILCAPFFGWSPNFGAGKLNLNLVIIISSFMKLLGYGQAYTYGASPPYLEKTLGGQTSDRVRFQKRIEFYKVEPHLLMGGPSWDWILESTKSLQLILQRERINTIQTPILLASGAKDGMVSPETHHQVASKCKQITLVDFPEAMHEILMEQDAIQEQFWEEFDHFMKQE